MICEFTPSGSRLPVSPWLIPNGKYNGVWRGKLIVFDVDLARGNVIYGIETERKARQETAVSVTIRGGAVSCEGIGGGHA